jgi:glycosyltransferase involved in cell wall biosynthesis
VSEPLTIAYLTSLYARSSDSFVRAEVAALRALGHTVHTFSIRRPPASELVSEAVRAEHDRTDYVLSHGPRALCASFLRMAGRRPAAFARAAALALRIGQPGARGRLWPLAYLAEAAHVAEQLERMDVQHLHDHIAEGSASVALLASELSGVPFSVTVHGPGEFDHPDTLALDVKLARASFFVAISSFARSQVLRWTRPADWERVHVVRCGVEQRFLERPPVPLPDAPLFVSIGRLDVQKGQLVLLEALASVRGEGVDAELTVVGDGPLRGQLEEAAARLGISSAVRFAGALAADDVVAEIERSRALVMASFAEGLPIVVMESLALGRPVIATDVGALGELVEPGSTGWLVPPAAVGALADAIRAAASAPVQELERMGEAGAARVRERHDPAREARRLEALFRASVARGAG